MVQLVYSLNIDDVIDAPDLLPPCHNKLQPMHDFCPECGKPNASYRGNNVGWAKGFSAEAPPWSPEQGYIIFDRAICWKGLTLNIPQDLTFASRWHVQVRGQSLEIVLHDDIVMIRDIKPAQDDLQKAMSCHNLEWKEDQMTLRERKTSDYAGGHIFL